MGRCFINEFGDEICQSGWYWYGRWVLLGVILFAAIAAYIIIACVTARKRRRQGRAPMPLTGWTLAVAPPKYEANPQPGEQTVRDPSNLTSAPPNYSARDQDDLELGQRKQEQTATQ